MSDEYQDPSGNTQAFRAFAQGNEPAEPAKSKLPLVAGGGVAVLVVLVVVLFLLLG